MAAIAKRGLMTLMRIYVKSMVFVVNQFDEKW